MSTASASEEDDRRLAPHPQPEQTPFELIARILRSRGALSGIRHWLLVRGSIYLAVVTVLYVGNGFLLGWQTAYDLTVGIRSPGDTRLPWAAWPLSLAGWLALPAIAGAIVGYLLTVDIGRRRQKSIDEVLSEPK